MSFDEILNKMKEKMDEGDFTMEEKEALKRSSDTVSRYTRVGILAGTTMGLGIAFRRKYTPINAAFLSTTMGIFGLSTGAIFGGVRGINIINELPEDNNVKRVFLEIRKDIMKEKMENPRGLPVLKPPPNQFPNRQFPSQHNQNDVTQVKEKNIASQNNSDNGFEEEQRASEPRTNWEQIRSQNPGGMSTWDKIRKESQQPKPRDQPPSQPTFDEEESKRQDFRSFEDRKQSQPKRTNQFGDPID